jgi:transcriptional regulator with XRE-family HTH domain
MSEIAIWPGSWPDPVLLGADRWWGSYEEHEFRAGRAITQEELARRTDLHPTYISDIERGARNPSFAVLTRLAAGLEVSMAELGAAYDRLGG